MFYSLKKILKKVAFKFVGRSGILYFNGKEEYLVGSDNYVDDLSSRDGYGVTIFSRDIQLVSSNKIVSFDKDGISTELKNILLQKGIKTNIV